MQSSPMLSKSQYMRGLQCVKSLWLYRQRKDPFELINGARGAAHLLDRRIAADLGNQRVVGFLPEP